MEIRSLGSVSFDEIYGAHLKAFKDYPFQWSREALRKTMLRRGFDAELSFGAFDHNELVSFTLNGIGNFNGLRTAYDTGTGTIEEYRANGLASKIFEKAAPLLKVAGIEQYILEVLEDNQKAFSVYHKQGFEISRKFIGYRVHMADWDFTCDKTSNGIELKQIDFNSQPQMERMHDFNLSWQNNFQALLKKPDDFMIIGAFRNEHLMGYGIIEPESGDVPLLAVKRDERRKGIGSAILYQLKKLNKAATLRITNIESSQPQIIEFIQKRGIPKMVNQYEMIKQL